MWAPSRTAVSTSATLIRNAPSPIAATTLRCGYSSFAASAPGSEKAMVARPLEIRHVLG